LQTGLVSEARNAKPLTDPREQSQASAIVKDAEKRPSLSIDLTPTSLLDEGRMDEKGLGIQAPDRVSGFAGVESDRGRPSDAGRGPVPVQPPPIRAERPSGVYAAGAVYAGRALAEWSIVVSECNSFVDRRRDEGVLGLSDVEVPALGVEGLGLGLKVRG
jgi:hypothetical protein